MTMLESSWPVGDLSNLKTTMAVYSYFIKYEYMCDDHCPMKRMRNITYDEVLVTKNIANPNVIATAIPGRQ